MALVLFWMIVPENSLCSRTELHRSTATVFFKDDTSRTIRLLSDEARQAKRLRRRSERRYRRTGLETDRRRCNVQGSTMARCETVRTQLNLYPFRTFKMT